MRIIIKIQSIEINVETDETAAAPAITAATTQAIEQMITPLVPTRARKTRTTEATPAVSLPRKGVVEPQVVTIPAATNGHDEAESAEETPKTEEPQTPESSKKRLPFEEFDRLVRAEMKRLAPSPGQMPSHNLWNEMRTPPPAHLGRGHQPLRLRRPQRLGQRAWHESATGQAWTRPSQSPHERSGLA